MKVYITGLILTILSWLACLNPYWIIFAGPVFLIGLLIVWLSKTTTKTKLLTTLLPLLLWYPGMLAFFFLGSKHMTPETFLVPKDFRGQITLIYDEPCGQTVPKVDGRLIYKIPNNGVMILKNEFETTIFEIGSATKTFTALLLAQKIEKGRIKPFDFIDTYLPRDLRLYCQMKSKVLMTDLATHQSGLPNLSSDQYFEDLMKKDPNNPFRFVDEEYLYEVLRNTDSLKEYRQYQYNNYAFSLLGSLLARHSKISYEELVSKNILEPLKMSSTTFSVSKEKNTAGLFSQRGEKQKPMILNAVNPAGGLHSNAVDLIKYLKAYHANPEFAGAVKRIEQTYYEDSKHRLGLGWEVGDSFLEKDGDTFGNSSLMRYSKKNNVAVVVLSNHQNGQLVRDVMNKIYAESIRKK